MADKILKLDTIEEYNRFLGAETLHPLVSVTDLSKLKSIRHCRKEFGFYCIYYKELKCGTIEYGRSRYDYQEGTLLFISPGQTGGVDDGGETLNPRGYALMFHPDLLYGTPLARRMSDYHFFSYASKIVPLDNHPTRKPADEIRLSIVLPTSAFFAGRFFNVAVRGFVAENLYFCT